MISVVIPAHNEASVIGRLLAVLLADADPQEFDVVVVPNGCTDDTAMIAESYGARVFPTDVKSKSHAMRLGDAHAEGFPRLYLDADVELGTADARALAAALRTPGVLAAAPQRSFTMDDSTLVVRMYYDVWQQLATVQNGLFGRGVVGVSAGGHERLTSLPEVMNDDLAASVAFAPAERRIVAGAHVRVHPPRTTGDLLRRRVRALTGIAQLHTMPGTAEARTTRADLLRVVRERPTIVPRMAVFLGVTAMARWKARRPIRSGDYTTWLRDESSRQVDIPTQRRDGATATGKEDR